MKTKKVHKEMKKMFIRVWGERCKVNEAGCPCCAAWVIYDAAKQMTDTSLDE